MNFLKFLKNKKTTSSQLIEEESAIKKPKSSPTPIVDTQQWGVGANGYSGATSFYVTGYTYTPQATTLPVQNNIIKKKLEHTQSLKMKPKHLDLMEDIKQALLNS
jgi:hypothetical protein